MATPAFPDARLSNGSLTAHLYLPDAARGFYRSTRFDWSGVIARVEYGGRRFYGPWFTAIDPPVHDFVYTDSGIVAGAQSAIVGPAEEFPEPQGYAAAAPGETFVKIGVGVLRRADATNYSAYNNYALVDHGAWSVDVQPDAVSFTQVVNDERSGYGYEYRKTVRLAPGRPELVIAHSLRNIGRLAIAARQYNHNFLTIDDAGPDPDYRITVPFAIHASRLPPPALATVDGGRITYARRFVDQDRVSFGIEGFGRTAADYDIRVEHARLGVGVRVTSDTPLASLALWSIRSVLSMEPFVDVSTAPGATTQWTYTYTYYAVR